MARWLNIDLPHSAAASIALAAIALGIVAALAQRHRIGRVTTLLFALAGLLLCLSAGGLRLILPAGQTVQVLVDLSPSTRGAAYRDPANLRTRIQQLLGDQRYQITAFAATNHALSLDAPLIEMPADQTRFAPDSNRPVLLFSDGQFDLPGVYPPTFVVIDPNLERPDDARILTAGRQGSHAYAVVECAQGGRMINGTSLPLGRSRVILEVTTIDLRLSPGDRWPENDVMALPPAQPAQMQWWRVGSAAPRWRTVPAERFPESAGDLLPVGMLAIHAREIPLLTLAQQTAIVQYVREMGGSLAILGGDQGWTGLRNSELAAISPLSADPPEPRHQWLVLIDASGSMSVTKGGRAQWTSALLAAEGMVRVLPPKDGVRIGSFAAAPRWWIADTAAALAASGLHPPADLQPHGPTNLQAALSQILLMPSTENRDLLVLSDAETEVTNLQELAGRLRAAKTRVSILMLSDGRGRDQLRELAQSTGGMAIAEPRPAAWYDSARKLAANAGPSRLETSTIDLRFVSPFETQRPADRWNLAWMKTDATPAAHARIAGNLQPLGARWAVGLGQVAAFAVDLQPAELDRLAQLLSRQPSDPAFQVSWKDDLQIGVTVTFAQPPDVPPTVQVRLIPSGASVALAQIGPSRFSATLAYPRRPQVAVICVNQHAIATRPVPSRYPVEFARIGTDRTHLEKLATQSGGRLIEPNDHAVVDFRLGNRFVNLSPWLALAALILLGFALPRIARLSRN